MHREAPPSRPLGGGQVPSPRTPDPRAAPPLRWGILGPGSIAHSFAKALTSFTTSTIEAVASRDITRAESFAQQHGAATAFGSYRELLEHDRVDIVYIALPHVAHAEATIAALGAGKHVLVEKPFAMTEAEATDMVAAARASGRLLMEAMWTRYIPAVDAVRQMLTDGHIGTPLALTADMSFRATPASAPRLFDPALGGGALLDTCVYPVSLSSLVFGEPQRVAATAVRDPRSGVETQVSAALHHASGAFAHLYGGIDFTSPSVAVIGGTSGSIVMHAPFYNTSGLSLCDPDGAIIEHRLFGGSASKDAFRYQIAEAARRVTAGDVESPLMPWDESVAVMRTLDRVRATIDLDLP